MKSRTITQVSKIKLDQLLAEKDAVSTLEAIEDESKRRFMLVVFAAFCTTDPAEVRGLNRVELVEFDGERKMKYKGDAVSINAFARSVDEFYKSCHQS